MNRAVQKLQEMLDERSRRPSIGGSEGEYTSGIGQGIAMALDAVKRIANENAAVKPTAAQLAKAIKQSYRRYYLSSNPIRVEQETDPLIDQLAAMVGPQGTDARDPSHEQDDDKWDDRFDRLAGGL